MRPTEREAQAWRKWLLGRHEKCPVCGRPMPAIAGPKKADRPALVTSRKL
ncbi:hypothetical protein HYR54_16660 [Candidatus Acetothermia bacterium]|nr:hypothetical protein [Candidatus Acetothermia bacterium]